MPDNLLRSAISMFLNKSKGGIRKVKKAADVKTESPAGSPAQPTAAEKNPEAAPSPVHLPGLAV